MVNQAVLTFHGWASRVGSLACPDWAIIDLDPGSSTTWAQLIEVANAVRALLELLEVPSLVKTSGQKGLHVLVPIAAGHTAAQCHEFSERVCKLVARLKPELVSLVAETGPRKGRLYLDCVQNYAARAWCCRTRCGRSMALRCRRRSPGPRSRLHSIRSPSPRAPFAPGSTRTAICSAACCEGLSSSPPCSRVFARRAERGRRLGWTPAARR